MSARLSATLVLALAWGVPAPAAASEPESRVLVLPVEFEGDVGDDERARLRTAVEEGLKRAELAFVDGGDGQGQACSDDRCRRKAMQAVGASIAVHTMVRVHDRVYELELRVIEGPDLTPRARAHDACEICGVEEVAERLADQVAIVAQKVQEVASRPRLRVEAQPRGARVYVDGTLVGTGSVALEIEPGPHVVRVEGDGYIGQERSIESRSGVEEQVELRLQPVPQTAADGRRRRLLVGLGGGALGAGLAAVGTGIPLVIIDGRQNERQCSGNDIDVNGTCRWTYSTMAGGATALAVGGALTITGAVLVGLGLRGPKRSESGARASVSPTWMGMSVRF